MGYYSYPKGGCECHFSVSEAEISQVKAQLRVCAEKSANGTADQKVS